MTVLFRALRLACIAGLASWPLVLPARAADRLGGATFAQTIEAEGQTLQLNGAGLRVYFHLVDAYATALYLSRPVHIADEIMKAPNPKVIFTQFLHDASLDDVRKAYDRIHKDYCATSSCNDAGEAAYRQFEATLSAEKAGQTQTLVITDTGVTVLHDNVKIAIIASGQFGASMVASLIGPASPTERYRQGIIGP